MDKNYFINLLLFLAALRPRHLEGVNTENAHLLLPPMALRHPKTPG